MNKSIIKAVTRLRYLFQTDVGGYNLIDFILQTKKPLFRACTGKPRGEGPL